MNEDKNVCDKCGGRLALVVGTFIYRPDDEPYESGVIEKSIATDGEIQISAHKCDKCGHLQGFFIE
ncbi:hypothetical protein [Bacteroides salyersiae]|uniref:hypothetical protein n=1 Tax=Bacteroides salyersiae TaxID=291644 RepID=UPI000326ED51|nr:hypothetical protein [Bacteroides salyersiae]EOA48948.1 hypothetical protein HMPREF1532_02582 [Bacteroides salyersiae WAL 10018 = DSM 18765 = JCM 12988]